jgi:hypothetical protein
MSHPLIEVLVLFCFLMGAVMAWFGLGAILYRIAVGEWPDNSLGQENKPKDPVAPVIAFPSMDKMIRNPFCNGRFANERCFCRSGRKLKQCHGKAYAVTEKEHQEAMELFKEWEDSPEGAAFFSEVRR